LRPIFIVLAFFNALIFLSKGSAIVLPTYIFA